MNKLALCVLVMSAAWFGADAQCVANSGMSIHTTKTDYVSNNSLPLNKITVTYTDQFGATVNSAVAVYIDPTEEPNLGLVVDSSETFNRTTASGTGKASWETLRLENPKIGTYYMKVWFCGIYSSLELIISPGAVVGGKWVVEPVPYATSYGELPIRPEVALVDIAGNPVEQASGTTWELKSNDTTVTVYNGNNPTITSLGTARFDTLRVSSHQPPTKFNLTLFVNGVEKLYKEIRFVACDHNMLVRPTGFVTSNNIFTISTTQSSPYTVPIRGWNFPLMAAQLGKCRYTQQHPSIGSPTITLMAFHDTCNIACDVPITAGARGKLEYSANGVTFDDITSINFVSTPTKLVITPPTQYELRAPTVITKFKAHVVDNTGNIMWDKTPAAATSVVCTTPSPSANEKIESSSQLTIPFVNGEADAQFKFLGNLDAERHVFICNTPGDTSIAGATFNFTIEEGCKSPPVVTTIQSANGCIVNSDGDFISCPTNGSFTLTINGYNFGLAGATVRVGWRFCDSVIHDDLIPSRQLRVTGCVGDSSNHTVIVYRPERLYGMWKHKLHYGIRPVINSIAGCEYNFYPSTANCRVDGASMVQIRGQHFGTSGAKVFFYYKVPLGATVRIQCQTVTHTGPGSVNCTGFPGVGQVFDVAVQNNWGELTRTNEVSMSYVATIVYSCPEWGGLQCNAKGNCNTTNGQCMCFNDATNGYWGGAACEACQPTYFGGTCVGRCPGGATPCGGNTRGTCSQGITGSGKCTCVKGYGGTACDAVCPGGVSSPCSNHGACVQQINPPNCSCYANLTHGTWTGALCSTCASTHVGSSCDQACPLGTGGAVCSGRGNCISVGGGAACQCTVAGYCGSACELSGVSCGACPTGYYGSGCSNQCPGFSSSGGSVTVCSARGQCSEGVQGSGSCFCDAGYASASCSIACAGLSGSTPCSGHGTCNSLTGACVCQPGFATSTCGVQCPQDSNGNVCTNRGTCQDGASGDGKCTCNNGYAGSVCELECDGGAANPCSNHGTCSPTDGSCTCQSDANGYWQGTKCDTCQADYYGATCNGTCPKTNNVQCASHGQCTFEVVCACTANIVQGYWNEPLCADCKPNYYGATCNKQCPGGACNPCSNHGTCSDGKAGAGDCTCFANTTHGFWQGTKCSDCLTNYFGSTCVSKCPEINGLICNSHGTCDDGLRGGGLCNCTADSTNGYWGGTQCEKCASGYYGTDCLSQCPGPSTDWVSCSGNGLCNDGFLGDGTCACYTGYGTSDCSAACPRDTNTVGNPLCYGHGTCLDGANRTGTCECKYSSNDGFWSGAGCSDCAYGFFNSSCVAECPGANGSSTVSDDVCSGHGTCFSGIDANGTCDCITGYAGANCSIACDGLGSSGPCSGHGQCNTNDGTCTCNADETNGFWDGDSTCSSCNALWESDKCTTKCPTSPSNPDVPCNGQGTCISGTCKCWTQQYCGDACDETDEAICGQTKCNPAGTYGANCDRECPGRNSDGSVVCSGNGNCDDGKEGKGACTCSSGYWSDDCSQECPGGATNACSKHGTCNADGSCTCEIDEGWTTADCSQPCPGLYYLSGTFTLNGTKCSGNGRCETDGTCACDAGYAGTDCSTECPGGVNNICSLHGTCSSTTGKCTCDQSPSTGFWNGTNCSVCVSGYQGTDCKSICVNGHTEGKTCICDQNWSGPSCESFCPMNNGEICNGHGSCNWGEQYTTSSCTCTGGYFDTACETFCTADMCKQRPHFLQNGWCHNETGLCACIDDDVDGHWADTSTRCTTCKLGYYGTNCLKACPCRGRGSCDKSSGKCNCFDSDARGHFEGDSCERCKAGYIGTNCRAADVAVTRQRPASAIVRMQERSSFVLVDRERQIIYSGGRPMIVFNLSTRATLTTIDLGGTCISGAVRGNYIRIELNNIVGESNRYSARIVHIDRGLNNGMIRVRQQGKVYFFTTLVSNPSDNSTTTPAPATTVTPTPAAFTRRRLTSYSTFTTITAVETLTVGTDEYVTIMSNGVVSQSKGIDNVGEVQLNAYFTQVMCATLTSSIHISPTRLIIGGTLSGTWQLVSIPLPIVSNPTVDVLTSKLINTYCGTNNENCLAVGKIVSVGDFIVSAMITTTGAGLMRFRYTQIDNGGLIETSQILDGYDSSTYINATAMLLDSLSGAGFVAMNIKSPAGDEPSTIYKFSLLTLGVYGSVRFQRVGDAFEIVTGLTKDDVTRTLFATIPLDLQQNVVPLNLYAVTKVYPNIADTLGGTVITVEGEGFINDNLRCDFNGTLVAAKFITARAAECVAPVGGDERCQGNPLEISVGVDQFSKNNILLRRVSSPRITKVQSQAYVADGTDNAYGPLKGGSVIVVDGFGLQQSMHIACRIKSENVDDAQYAKFAERDYIYNEGKQGTPLNNARFVNATRIECDQPAFPGPTRGNAYLEVTLDGNVYSRSKQQYQVVGPAVGIRPFRYDPAQQDYVADFVEQYSSADEVKVDPFDIYVVDQQQQRLRRLDINGRVIAAKLTKYTPLEITTAGNITLNFTAYCQYNRVERDAPIMYNRSALMATSANGHANIGGMYFLQPPSGLYTVTFTDLTTMWAFNHTFTITIGSPYRLRICREPTNIIDNLNPTLPVQPMLYVEDVSGNQIPGTNLAGLKVEATYLVESTETSAVRSEDIRAKQTLGVPIKVNFTSKVEKRVAQVQESFLQFEGIEMRGLHGHTYHINFTSAGLIHVVSTEIAVKWCNNNTARAMGDPNTVMYFAKYNTSECFTCPDGGWCDGTTRITMRANNLWRPTENSYRFYTCEVPNSGDSCLMPNGTCKTGYEGPRCSVCKDGYGRSNKFYCKKCESEAIISMYVVLVAVIGVGFIAMMTYTSITSSMKETLPVVIKIGINHLQIASRINEIVDLPPALKKLFDAELNLAELIRIDLVTFECPPMNLDIYGKFYVALSFPFFMIACFGTLLLIRTLVRRCMGGNKAAGPTQVSGNATQKVRRDRVMLAVAKFMARLRGAMQQHHGDLDRDDLHPQHFTSPQLYAATIMIILFLMYPSILQSCANMWKCDNLVFGDGSTYSERSFLTIDRSVDCETSSHQLAMALALVAACVYGIGTPIMGVILVKYHWRQYGRVHTRRLYNFITSGYAVETWWWEAVVAARKALVVFIIVFVNDETLRVYCSMWVLTLALGAHGWWQPFDVRRPLLYYLEGIALASLVITLNLSLLFQFSIFGYGRDETSGYVVLVVFLFAVNVLVGVLILFFVLQQFGIRIRRFVQRRRGVAAAAAAEAAEKQPQEMQERPGSANSFTDVSKATAADRRTVQSEGLFRALKRASVTATSETVVGETPFQRVKRLEAERKAQQTRVKQMEDQSALEEELQNLKDRMVKAQALAAAEEAVLRKSNSLVSRAEHEKTLTAMMEQIRNERMQFEQNLEGHNRVAEELMQSIQFEQQQ